MKQKYAFQGFDTEKMARARGVDLPISVKHAAMVCNAIRYKSVERARTILADAIELKKAIAFTKFNSDRGHKPKIGPGRYPVKTCTEILKILNLAEVNGHQKNLADMYVIHVCAHKAAVPWHYGRFRRRQMKRSHVELVIAEKESKSNKKEKAAEKKPEAKEQVKAEKPAEKVQEKKTEKTEQKTEIKKTEIKETKEAKEDKK